MSDNYLSYRITTPAGPQCLAIHLRDPHGRPQHQRLRALHAAANAWARKGLQIRSDLSIRPPSGSDVQELVDYLFADGSENGPRLQRHLSMLLANRPLHRYTIRPGSPVEGSDLVGREEVVAALLAHLTDKSCHVRAPRRYGKTCILKRVEQELQKQNVPCALIDVSECSSALWFFVAVATGVMDRFGTRPSIESIEELKDWPPVDCEPLLRAEAERALAITIRTNPWHFGRRLLAALADVHMTLLLDEFSVFLREVLKDHRDEARRLLRMLAEARRSTRRIHMALAGSAGLTAYVRFAGLEQELKDLTPIEIEPLSNQEGLVLAEELIYGGFRLPGPGAASEMLAVVGPPVPYFLHALANEICSMTTESTPITASVVRHAYRERLLGSSGNFYFRVYRLQNQTYPDHLRSAASSILSMVARHPQGVPENTLRDLFVGRVAESKHDQFEELFPCLQEDYDLIEGPEGWMMRCKALRDRLALSGAWLAEEE